MREIDEFTMSGKTIDFLRKAIFDLFKYPEEEMNDQIHMELANLAEALNAPDGFSVTFDFTYNS